MALSRCLLPSVTPIIIFLLSLAAFGICNADDDSSSDIHDILSEFNLPKGILPNGVNSYTLSSQDGSFTVTMEHPCYVKFFDDQIVYYDKVIKGKLSYGKVTHVSGIQAKKFFIWVPVTGMDMDVDSGLVEFHVGALSQKFPAKQFEIIPTCMNKACSRSTGSGSAVKLRLFWINYYYSL